MLSLHYQINSGYFLISLVISLWVRGYSDICCLLSKYFPAENLSSFAHPLFFTPPSPHRKATSSPESELAHWHPISPLLHTPPLTGTCPGLTPRQLDPGRDSTLTQQPAQSWHGQEGHPGRRQAAVTGVAAWEPGASGLSCWNHFKYDFLLLFLLIFLIYEEKLPLITCQAPYKTSHLIF